MFRWMSVDTRKDRIRNEFICEKLETVPDRDKMRGSCLKLVVGEMKTNERAVDYGCRRFKDERRAKNNMIGGSAEIHRVL